MVKCLPAMLETWVRSLGWEDPRRRKWQPTPVLLENPMDRGVWRAIVCGIAKNQTRLSDFNYLLTKYMKRCSTSLVIVVVIQSQSRVRLCDPTYWSMPGFSELHYLLGFVQVHIHWIGDAISSSAFLFSFCLQFFPELGSFPLNWLFASGGQGIGTSVSASVLPMSIQGWFPLGFTGLISLLSKGLSRVFSSTTVWKHQFFGP